MLMFVILNWETKQNNGRNSKMKKARQIRPLHHPDTILNMFLTVNLYSEIKCLLGGSI